MKIVLQVFAFSYVFAFFFVFAFTPMQLLPAAYGAALPGDGANGKRLYEANCTGCHDTSVMSRPDRRVQSLDGLKEQLGGCSHMAKATFSPSETEDLVKYLNDEFYKFR